MVKKRKSPDPEWHDTKNRPGVVKPPPIKTMRSGWSRSAFTTSFAPEPRLHVPSTVPSALFNRAMRFWLAPLTGWLIDSRAEPQFVALAVNFDDG